MVSAGSVGWKVTEGLCWADNRKPMDSRLRLTHVPVRKKEKNAVPNLAPMFLQDTWNLLQHSPLVNYVVGQLEVIPDWL